MPEFAPSLPPTLDNVPSIEGQPLPTAADLAGRPYALPIDILADNQSAIKLLRNPISSLRSKHIDVVHHFARERVSRNQISFTYIKTDHMVADALTKPVSATKFNFCRAGMGLS